MNYIILLGAFQAIAAFGIFFWNNKNKSSDQVLAWLLGAIFIHLSIKFVIYVVLDYQFVKTGYNTFINFAYGPLIWLFTKEIAKGANQKIKSSKFLFLPTFIAAFSYLLITFYLIYDPTHGVSIVKKYNDITVFFILISYLLYPIKSFLLCRTLPAFWELEKRLITFIASAFFMVGLIFTFQQFYNIWGDLSVFPKLDLWDRMISYSLLLSICLAIIGYKIVLLKNIPGLVKNPQDLSIVPALENSTEVLLKNITGQNSESVRKQILTTEQQKAVIDKIDRFMEKEKIFRDAELSLDQMALAMKISKHHISESLNQYLGYSFYQYINDKRMKEVISLMDKFKQRKGMPNILSMAYEAGFNSKSSFYQYFKKEMGCTPSEYLKNQNVLAKVSIISLSNS